VARSGASYTLIGRSKAGAGQGTEYQGEATTPARGMNTVALEGNFSHSSDFGYELADSSPSRLAVGTPEHEAGEMLSETLVQEPTAWPGQDDPHQVAAVAYIGKQAFAGDDVRTQYWASGQNDTWWTQKRTDVGNVAFPSTPNPGFSSDELDTAKKQIQQEITWLLSVRGLTERLASPFTKGGLEKWADLNQITATVDKSVQGPDQNKAEAIAYAIFNGVREIATVIPEVGEAIGVVNQIFDTALEISSIASEGNEPADEPFEVQAAQVGSRLVSRLSTASDTLTTEMTNAIVADYGKLARAGSCNLQQLPCPDNPQLWKFDANDQLNASTGLRYGTAVTAYGAIVPARWTLWRLGQECYGSQGFTCWETGFQGDGFWGGVGAFNAPVCPILENHPSTSLIRPVYRDIPRYANDAGFQGGNPHPVDIWQVYALANISGGGVVGNTYKSELPNDILTRVFAPVDPAGDFSKGGLGAQPEQFFMGSMTPKLMAARGTGQPYPYLDSRPAWNGKNTDCVRW
jgi:hypothetical protein